MNFEQKEKRFEKSTLRINTNRELFAALNSTHKKEPLTPISGEESANSSAPITPTTPKQHLLEPTNLDEEKSVSITSLASIHNEEISFIDEGRELTDRSSMTPDLQKSNVTEEVSDTNKLKPFSEVPPNSKKDPIVTEVNVLDIIKKFDEQKNPVVKITPRTMVKKPPEITIKPDDKPQKTKPAVPPRSATTKLRGRLDKSHSTPAYDLTEEPLEVFPIMETKPIQPLDDSLNELGIPVVEAINPRLPDLVQIKHEVSVPMENKLTIMETKSIIQENSVVVGETMTDTSSNNSEISELKREVHNVFDMIPDVTKPSVTPEVLETADVPPKPPPRNFIDLPKPIYPADSPKPQLNTPKSTSENVNSTKQVFEYPEAVMGSQTSLVLQEDNKTQQIISYEFVEEKPPLRNFEPKVASTPVSKIKAEPDAESLYMYKTIPSYELQKSFVDKKVSPTNSIVKAMIKGKSGKKKNSLIASE